MLKIHKGFNVLLYRKYKAQAKKVNNIIQKLQNAHPHKISDDIFLKNLLSHKSKLTRVAAAYFILSKYIHKSLFDVQITAVLAMLDGYFVDVKTGEGKTLIIGAYCLVVKKPVHVFTVNDYLAEEAIRQLGDMYQAFDLSFGVLTSQNLGEDFDMQKDIIYGTAASFAFQYIMQRFNRNLDYQLHIAVVDEADYVLIDNATSAFSVGVDDDSLIQYKHLGLVEFIEKIQNVFSKAVFLELNYDEVQAWANLENSLTNTIFINQALKFIDFSQDIQDKIIDLSKNGCLSPSEALAFMYGVANACYVYEKNIDYIVAEDDILLVDKHNGRTLPNSKHDIYLQLALLVKESCIKPSQTQTIGKIANQVYFLKYKEVIGLSGSLLPVQEELSKIFKTGVVAVPQNKTPVINKTYHFTKNKNDLLLQIVSRNINEKKASLIICKSDKDATNVSRFLSERGYENVLFNNTTATVSENTIISGAGESKKITISTLLFGRGTNIIPDDSTVLSVIIYEVFGCKRAEIQISGRTGRQGRAGDVHIFVSEDDEIFQYVDCKTKSKLNKNNYVSIIRRAISNIYGTNAQIRERSTYFAYYIDLIYEYYYQHIKDTTYDNWFLTQIDALEQISFNLANKEESSRLIMKEAKKIIDTVQYYAMNHKGGIPCQI